MSQEEEEPRAATARAARHAALGLEPAKLLTMYRQMVLARARIITTSSTVATQVLHAAGIAYAAKVRGLDEVAVACLGEGSTSEGDWHEALNFAGVHALPFICLVEDNDYAISVPHRLQMGVASVAERARGYGIAGASVDGGDVLAVYEAMKAAVGRARSGGGATLIAAKVP